MDASRFGGSVALRKRPFACAKLLRSRKRTSRTSVRGRSCELNPDRGPDICQVRLWAGAPTGQNGDALAAARTAIDAPSMAVSSPAPSSQTRADDRITKIKARGEHSIK